MSKSRTESYTYKKPGFLGSPSKTVTVRNTKRS